MLDINGSVYGSGRVGLARKCPVSYGRLRLRTAKAKEGEGNGRLRLKKATFKEG